MPLSKLHDRFLTGFAEELGRWSARTMLAAVITVIAALLIG
jgi:hypothetical protein